MAMCAQMGSEVAQEEQDTNSNLQPLPSQISRLHRASNTRLHDRQDMLQSLPTLGQRAISKQKRKNFSLDESSMISSQILVRPQKVEKVAEIAAPLPTDMKKFDLLPEMSASKAEGLPPGLEESDELDEKLLKELAAVFGLEQPEEVSKVYSCQTARNSHTSVIKGQLYVLQSVVCFHAYVPQRMKSGYLSKRGRQNPRYNKYWFILQGSTLSYYTDKAQPFFPRNSINISAATTVQITSPASQTDTCDFTIISGTETYYFRTGSMGEAQSWVKKLEMSVYRAQNDSDVIKQLIPIKSISNIEQEDGLVGFTTVQINVQGEDLAYDEVCTVMESYDLLTNNKKYIFMFLGNDIDVKERILDLQAALTESSGPEEFSPIIQPMHRQNVDPASRTCRPASRMSLDLIEPSESPQTRPGLSSYDSSSSLYQRASGIAEYLKSQPGQVRNVLATQSYSYYDKVKGMWQGNKTLYEDNDETSLHSIHELDEKTINEHNERFRKHFSLPMSERLQATYYCYLSQALQKYGKMYLAVSRICFRGLVPPFRTKVCLHSQV
jgi:hypothetical protein